MPEHKVHHAAFNQNKSLLAVCVEDGLRIFRWNDQLQIKPATNKKLAVPLSLAMILNNSNIIALVGAESNKESEWSKSKVHLWDIEKSASLGSIKFKRDIKSIRIFDNFIIAVLEHHVCVYQLDKFTRVRKHETVPNPLGIVSISDTGVIAILHTTTGVIRITDATNDKRLITAHNSGIRCMTLNSNGSMIATASERGTVIRVFSTTTGDKLREFRRGADAAEIYSIAFSNDSKKIACSSSKGTVHVFLMDRQSGGSHSNQTSQLTLLGSIFSYFSSEWSFSKSDSDKELLSVPNIIAFDQNATSILVVTMDGNYIRLSFDEKGEMTRVGFNNFLKS